MNEIKVNVSVDGFFVGFIAGIIAMALLFAFNPVKVNAAELDGVKVRCTIYLPTGNKTATGITPYQGIIAANVEHLNQECELYTVNGDFIGIFVCEDTGGHKGLKNGTRIDVYRDNYENYRKWVEKYGDYVMIKWR